MLTRRRFLATAACTMAAARLHAQGQSKVRVALTIPREATGPRMPMDFVGLSYEVQQLADPSFFSAQNSGLIREFKALSSTGVLRLGGNTSEFAYWGNLSLTFPTRASSSREVVGEPKAEYYAVTPEAIRNLAEFLQATGWTCVHGIGMGTNTPARAADEAVFVAETLGDRLQYFQIGNEADLFDRHLRDPKTWSAKTYLQEWLTLACAIAARVPAAKFGMPDVAGAVSWLTDIADQWPSIQAPPRVTTLTHHYYFGGPATNPEVNIPNLLKPATMQKVQNTANIASVAASKMGVRVRMTEGNTLLSRRQAGCLRCICRCALVCRLFAPPGQQRLFRRQSARRYWQICGQFRWRISARRRASANEWRNSRQIAAHPHPFYTAIATFGSDYVLEPVAYGLKFAGSFSGGTLFEDRVLDEAAGFGSQRNGVCRETAWRATSVIILNKDAAADLEAELDLGRDASGVVQIETLHAPALDSREAHILTSTRTDSSSRASAPLLFPMRRAYV